MTVSAFHPLPTAVHPPKCACTGCDAGDSKPLDETTHLEREAMITGAARDVTGMSFADLYRYLRENHPEDLAVDGALLAAA